MVFSLKMRYPTLGKSLKMCSCSHILVRARIILTKCRSGGGWHLYSVKPKIRDILSKDFILWLTDKLTIYEIREHFKISKEGFKRLAYIFYYGAFFVTAKRMIEKNHLLQDDTVIYSFWLSRAGYSAAELKRNYPQVKKAVSRAHRYDLYEEQNNLHYLPFRKTIAEGLSEISFISENGENYFNSKYKDYDITKTTISHLGVKDRGCSLLKLEGKVVFASCSAITPVKRIDLIIKCLCELKIDFEWYHVGSGDLLDKMEKLASSLLRNGSYHFVGNVTNDCIIDLYRSKNVNYFINLSDSEGIPVSIMEAISTGIPVIARNVGGNCEIVSEQDGFLLQSKDDRQIIDEFIEINFLDENLYKQKSYGARKIYEEQFSADNNYMDFFSRLADMSNC